MNIERGKKKIEAVKRLVMLDIFGDAIEQFEKFDTVMVSEPPMGGLYWLNDEEKEMVAEFEREYDALVYLVVRAYTEFGKCDSLLYVSDEEEEWGMDYDDFKMGYAMTYTINHDNPHYSEFGSIAFKKLYGGLVRVG